MPEVLCYAAFTTDPEGGNLAEIILDASTCSLEQMQIAAAVATWKQTLSPPHIARHLHYSPRRGWGMLTMELAAEAPRGRVSGSACELG